MYQGEKKKNQKPKKLCARKSNPELQATAPLATQPVTNRAGVRTQHKGLKKNYCYQGKTKINK